MVGSLRIECSSSSCVEEEETGWRSRFEDWCWRSRVVDWGLKKVEGWGMLKIECWRLKRRIITDVCSSTSSSSESLNSKTSSNTHSSQSVSSGNTASPNYHNEMGRKQMPIYSNLAKGRILVPSLSNMSEFIIWCPGSNPYSPGRSGYILRQVVSYTKTDSTPVRQYDLL